VIVTVGSVRGSPGATSWSLLLAAAWPATNDEAPAVIEADVAGGVLGVRYGFGVDPGAVSLTAALRRSDDLVPVEAHARALAGRVWVVPGPESAEQAAGLWENSASAVADRLAADQRVWFADVGRITSQPSARAFAARSAFTMLVCRANAEDVVALPSRVAALRSCCTERLGVLVTGRASHSIDDLRAFSGVEDVWVVGDETDLPATVGAVLAGKPRARRTLAWRDALTVASCLATLITTPTFAETTGRRR
jgi:hypothetical protein